MTSSAPAVQAPPRPRLRRSLPAVPPLPAWQIVLGGGVGLLVALLSGLPIFAFMVAFGVPYALVTSLRTKVLGYFVALPLVGGLAYQLPGSGVHLVPSYMVAAIFLQLVLQLFTGRITLPVRHPLVLLASAYALIVITQVFAPLARQEGVALIGARAYLEPFVLFVAGLVFWRDPDAPRLFFRVGVITALLVGLYMLKQLIFGFSPAELSFQAERFNFRAVSEQRLFSTLSGPAVYAFATVMFTLLCLAARMARVTPQRLTMAAGAISAVGIVTSGTRIALIGAVPAVIMMLALIATTPGGRRFARRIGAVAAMTAIVLGAIIALTPIQERSAVPQAGNAFESAILKLAMLKAGTQDEDFASRQERFEKFTDYMRRYPGGAGTGIVQIVEFQPPQTGALRIEPQLPAQLRGETWIFQHDFYYFSIGVELGLIAIFLYVLIFVGGVVFCLGGRKGIDDPADRMLMCLAATVLLFVMIHNLTNEGFRAPQMSSYAWILLAVPVVLLDRRRTSQRPRKRVVVE